MADDDKPNLLNYAMPHRRPLSLLQIALVVFAIVLLAASPLFLIAAISILRS